MNNSVFGEIMEIVRKHRDIKLVTIERRRNYFVSEANYHTTKFFTEKLLAIEMKKKQQQIFMNKPVYLGLSILELSKTFNKVSCILQKRLKLDLILQLMN